MGRRSRRDGCRQTHMEEWGTSESFSGAGVLGSKERRMWVRLQRSAASMHIELRCPKDEVEMCLEISEYRPRVFYNRYVKRGLDLLFALILLLMLSPFLTIIAVMIRIGSPGSVLYRGVRTGLGGRKFRVFKFRTMIEGAEKLGGGTTAKNDPRITGIGRYLRKSKLDEVPQLLNIILGQMSFVGPRPELPRYAGLYRGEETIILDVRPGITDYSSIEFIDQEEIVGETEADETFERKVLHRKNALRVQYVLRQNFITDLMLLLKTAMLVALRMLRLTLRNEEHERKNKDPEDGS